MGWIFCIGLFLVGCFTHNDALIIASGLYAISGSISSLIVSITKSNKN